MLQLKVLDAEKKTSRREKALSGGYGREEHELARSKRHSLSLISLEEGRRWGRVGITVLLWLLLLSGCACAFIRRQQIQPGADEEDQSCSHTYRPRQRAWSLRRECFSNTIAQLGQAARLKENVLM